MLSKVRHIKISQMLKCERKYVLKSMNYGCTLLIGLQRLNELMIYIYIKCLEHSLTSCRCHDFAVIGFANTDHYYYKEINENLKRCKISDST